MTEWTKKKYNDAYTEYMPWIEDKVLGYWGENKTSYTAKGTLPFLHPSKPFLQPLPTPILHPIPIPYPPPTSPSFPHPHLITSPSLPTPH